jgi:hypothetical protein
MGCVDLAIFRHCLKKEQRHIAKHLNFAYGLNLFFVAQIGASSMILETAADEVHSVHRKSDYYPDLLCNPLGSYDLPHPAGAGNGCLSRFWLYHCCLHADMVLPGLDTACPMELRL